jgi:hypothetical protein
MNVLAFETDVVQAHGIRHVVSNLIGARLTVATSVEQALHLLRTSTPDLVLLPALVSPSQEITLIEALRSLPDASHVDTLITPVLPPRSETLITSSQGWRRWNSRRATPQTTSAEANAFAESVRWALERVRERKAHRVPVEHVAAAEAVEPAEHVEPVAEQLVELVPLSFQLPNAPSDLLVAPSELVVVQSERHVTASAPQSLLRLLEDSDSMHVRHPEDLELQDATNRLLKKLGQASASDRRQHRRFAASELPGLRSARIKFGPSVAVVDVSAGGALLETDARLPPDSEALLELFGSAGQTVVPFRVLRCSAAGLQGGPRYLGACAFKQPLDLDELAWAAAGGAGLDAQAPSLALVRGRVTVRNAW